jgi:hypothetical protein
MKSKHPHAHRIARVVRRHWLSIPDDLERTKAVAREALKTWAPKTKSTSTNAAS